jgi:hypothetical protein
MVLGKREITNQTEAVQKRSWQAGTEEYGKV